MFESIKKWHFRNSLSERIFDILNIIFLAIIGFVSFSTPPPEIDPLTH